MNAQWAVRSGGEADVAAWAALRGALWPEEQTQRHAHDIHAMLGQPERMVGFLALDATGTVRGFAEATLRGDYVNGTSTSPVGFLEGWYVEPACRGQGAGRALIDAVEQWARDRGCSELASDSLLDNVAGHRAHRACGFEETERVVYFRKSLAE